MRGEAVNLPGEIWTQLLELGVERAILDHRDLCSLAIACRTLRTLSSLDSLWRTLYDRDFHEELSSPNFKSKYQTRFERERAKRLAAHKRRVLRVQSQMAVLKKEVLVLEKCISSEREKLLSVMSESKYLERAREASVALHLWQPQVVHKSHERLVEQQPVNSESRYQILAMEAKVCKEQIERFNKSLRHKRALVKKLSNESMAMMYKPLQEASKNGGIEVETSYVPNKKREKRGIDSEYNTPLTCKSSFK